VLKPSLSTAKPTGVTHEHHLRIVLVEIATAVLLRHRAFCPYHSRYCGAFAPRLDRPPDKDLINRLIAQAEVESVSPDRQARQTLDRYPSPLSRSILGPAPRRIFAALSERLCKWSSASAWYSLHGDFFLGWLVAVNSLSVIRQRMPHRMRK